MNKFIYYIFHILIGLFFAQFLDQQPNFIIAAALALLLIHTLIIYFVLDDGFLFILYIFCLCFIFTNDLLGGITILPFTVLFIPVIISGKIKIRDNFIKICLYILIVTNLLGYIFINQTEAANRIQSFVIFTGIILLFIFIQDFNFKRAHGKIIINVLTFMSVLSFLVAFNQKYVVIDSSLPLLGAIKYPSVRMVGGLYYGRFPSLLGDYELFAEYSLLFFIIAYSIILDSKLYKYFDLKFTPFILLGSSFLCILMTGTRSGFLLIFLFVFLFTFLRGKALISKSFLRVLLIISVALPVLLIFRDVIGLENVIHRFKQIKINNLSFESLKSGEELNRGLVYARGYARLAENNWFLGFGYGRGYGNHWAWWGSAFHGQKDRITDFHSLYLSFPMIYGWLGGFAYLSIIVYIIIKSFLKFIRIKKHPIRGVFLGLSFLFLFFLADQIKINSLRYYNFHLLIWILMGFALSVISNKIKEEDESSLVD